jgi:hypothetical protein
MGSRYPIRSSRFIQVVQAAAMAAGNFQINVF